MNIILSYTHTHTHLLQHPYMGIPPSPYHRPSERIRYSPSFPTGKIASISYHLNKTSLAAFKTLNSKSGLSHLARQRDTDVLCIPGSLTLCIWQIKLTNQPTIQMISNSFTNRSCNSTVSSDRMVVSMITNYQKLQVHV